MHRITILALTAGLISCAKPNGTATQDTPQLPPLAAPTDVPVRPTYGDLVIRPVPGWLAQQFDRAKSDSPEHWLNYALVHDHFSDASVKIYVYQAGTFASETLTIPDDGTIVRQYISDRANGVYGYLYARSGMSGKVLQFPLPGQPLIIRAVGQWPEKHHQKAEAEFDAMVKSLSVK